jgi:alcohol dehydrogenase (cytochrome c)
MRSRTRIYAVALAAVCLVCLRAQAQVSPDRLLNATQEPQNWLTYSGSYSSQRHSPLTQIDLSNAKKLELRWIYQAAVSGSWQATPLVVDGVMYVTQRPNDVVALDAKTGRVYWIYRYNPGSHKACCGANNRGLAILGDTLFMAALDAHLIAIDTKSGRPIWNTTVANNQERDYALTHAPLVIKDKVIVGVSGGDHGIRGFIAAYDAHSGKEVWRFNTIPGPGEPGHETWKPCPPGAPTSPTSPDYCDPNAWDHGGGAIWVTGSYDPSLNLTYWGIGNPGPDWNPAQRPGDNLYTNSVVALNADTGKLAWHFQFTPHDAYDYDSTQVPILADVQRNGTLTKAMLFANRNGFFYLLNRASGEFLRGTPYISKMNWASGLDRFGRPIQTPPPAGEPTYPGHRGGTNWFSPSYSPRTGLFYVSTWQNFGSVYRPTPEEFQGPGSFNGGRLGSPVPQNVPPNRGPINTWTDVPGSGALLALDPVTGAAIV